MAHCGEKEGVIWFNGGGAKETDDLSIISSERMKNLTLTWRDVSVKEGEDGLHWAGEAEETEDARVCEVTPWALSLWSWQKPAVGASSVSSPFPDVVNMYYTWTPRLSGLPAAEMFPELLYVDGSSCPRSEGSPRS